MGGSGERFGGRDESGHRFEGLHPRGLIVEGPVDEPIQSGHVTRATERDQFDFPLVARFESYGGAGRDIQPHSVRRLSIECEPAVGLEKMTVRTHLNRTISSIANNEANGP